MKGRRKSKKRYFPLSKKIRKPEDYVKTRVTNQGWNLKERTIYPWEDWMDGSWWSITKYSDYQIETIQMVKSLQVRGWRKGYRVHTIQVDEQTIWFHFYTGKRINIRKDDLGLSDFRKMRMNHSRYVPGKVLGRRIKLNK